MQQALLKESNHAWWCTFKINYIPDKGWSLISHRTEILHKINSHLLY